MARRRTRKEIQDLVEQYRSSGMTQRAYSEQVGIALSSLGRHLRGPKRGRRLVQVKLQAAPPEPNRGFALVLSNGRRIETGWTFHDIDLARLIRVIEGA